MNAKKKEAHELPEDVELLLPWHAAGTLSRRDAARVEQALANDNELAARYELVREELGEAIRLNETLGAPSARAMEALFAKIDAEPARKPKVVVQPHRLADRFRRRLLAAHAGLRRDRRGARDRAAGGHPRRRVREGRLGRSADPCLSYGCRRQRRRLCPHPLQAARRPLPTSPRS